MSNCKAYGQISAAAELSLLTGLSRLTKPGSSHLQVEQSSFLGRCGIVEKVDTESKEIASAEPSGVRPTSGRIWRQQSEKWKGK